MPKGLLEALDVDTRQGAHQLAKRIRQRYRSNRSEGQRLHTLLRFEIDLWSQGFSLVAGVDEAGMAPLAGPVVAGAVILPQNYKLRGLNDSKKILDPEMRDELAIQIARGAAHFLQKDLVEATKDLKDDKLQAAFSVSNRKAVTALNEYASWLEREPQPI